MDKTYSSCKDLVYDSLNQRKEQGADIQAIITMSQYSIDSFYFEMQSKAHLCKRPIKFSNVNRLVELWLRAQLTLESIARS